MALHKLLGIGDIHVPHQWEYADSTARGSATGFLPTDVGKLARQLDDNTLWILTDDSPVTWKSAIGAHAAAHQNGGGDEVATATAAANAIPKANASAKLDIGWIPTGATGTTVCIGNDSRLSDSRAPNGSASGDLAGSYPGPTVAQASQAFALTGVISPTSIGSNQNDYNPTGLSTTSRIRVTSSDAYNITGLVGGALGRILSIFNIGSFNITFTNEDVASTAANRFNFAGSGNIVLTPNKAIILQYDNTSSRWRCVSAADPYGTAVNTICAGNDARLSDNRTDANAIHKNVAAEISTVTEKTSPVAADLILIEDSAASNAKKKLQLGNLPSSIVGSNLQTASDATRTTTTSASYGTKITITTGANTGTYLVSWSCVLDQGGANQVGLARLYNSSDAAVLSEQSQRPSATTAKSGMGGIAFITLAGVAKTINLEFCSGTAGNTTGCQYAYMSIWRIS